MEWYCIRFYTSELKSIKVKHESRNRRCGNSFNYLSLYFETGSTLASWSTDRVLKALATRVFQLRVDQAEADERCSKSNFFSFSFFMCLSPVQSQVLHGFFFDKCNIFIISSCQKLPLKGSKTKTKTFCFLLFLIVFEVQGYHYFQNKRSDQNQFLRWRIIFSKNIFIGPRLIYSWSNFFYLIGGGLGPWGRLTEAEIGGKATVFISASTFYYLIG